MFEKQLSLYNKYRVFGLNIHSEINLPELRTEEFEVPDVTIKYSVNPEKLDSPIHSGLLFTANKKELLLKMPEVASYHIKDGKSINIDKQIDSKENEVRLFLFGSAFGALFHQRDILPIHGSAVVKNGKAIIIAGASGVGKSSVAAILSKRGFHPLCDDICAIFEENKQSFVLKGIPQLKLWKDTIEHLGNQTSDYSKVRDELEKFRVPSSNKSLSEFYPISAVVILSKKNEDKYTFTEVKGIKKFAYLKNNIFRQQFINRTELSSETFTELTMLSQSARVFLMERPSQKLELKDLALYLENRLIEADICLK